MSVPPILQDLLADAGVHMEVHTYLLFFALIFARLAAALALIPFLGGPSVPGRVKVGLAAVIAFVLSPSLMRSIGALPESLLHYLALLAKELLVGVVIGLITQMVFYGVEIAGTVIDTQRGLNQITYRAPQLPGNMSALGSLQFQASIALFLAMGGHLIFLRALAGSFLTIPLLQIPHLSAGWVALAAQFTRISAMALLIGAELCAPVVLAIFLVDVSFACVGKVASSIHISEDANIAKCWIGLAVFLVSVAFFLERLQKFLLSTIPMIESFTKSLA